MSLVFKISVGLWLLLISCGTSHKISSAVHPEIPQISEEEYSKIIELNTLSDDRYSGFYSTFQYHATILTSSVLEAQLTLKAMDFKWGREEYFREKEKVSETLNRESKFFVSFFSPVNENDNLDSNKTIWKLWLVLDNARYEGTATKATGILAQHQRFYPYHSRFFTPYIISFRVPMSKVQLAPLKLVLTGTVGNSELAFNNYK